MLFTRSQHPLDIERAQHTVFSRADR
jgi:hypothetical protein